jgi:DNA topoisomerase-1
VAQQSSPIVTPDLASLQAATKVAGLRFVKDSRPGITPIRASDRFAYRNPDGSRVTNDETLMRIRKLAIPPAYENVWICPIPNDHLQAVGRDAHGRKYRYHPRWREVRDEGKYGKMLLEPATGGVRSAVVASETVASQFGRQTGPKEKRAVVVVGGTGHTRDARATAP